MRQGERKAPARIAGYASLFDERDGAGDLVRKGAFRTSIRQRGPGRIAMLWQHDPGRPIGRWTRLLETRRGLWAEGELTVGVALSAEAGQLMAAGALSGLSIGFRARCAIRGGRGAGRILADIDLWEISLVTFPQLDGARARLVATQGVLR